MQNIWNTSEKIPINSSHHLRTRKHKWSDLSAKNAVSLFQSWTTKLSVKENRKPKKYPL